MRFTTTEWRRVGVLAALTLLVAAVLVFRGGGSSDREVVSSPTPTPVIGGTSAVDQVAEADRAGTAAVAPDEENTGDEREIVQSGLKTFTGALTGPVVYGVPSVENEYQFSVAVEDGIGVEATELAAIVDEVLGDARSWASSPDFGLVRVESGGHFQLVVASPETTDEICAPLQTIGQLSCAIDGVVAINLERWLTGSRGWTGTLEEYRAWVINHEVGHQLGESHRRCPGPGQLAPVMQQQSIDLDGCEPNPWPFPEGAPRGEETVNGPDDGETQPSPEPSNEPES